MHTHFYDPSLWGCEYMHTHLYNIFIDYFDLVLLNVIADLKSFYMIVLEFDEDITIDLLAKFSTWYQCDSSYPSQ